MKAKILAAVLLTLSSFSFDSNANACDTGSCGDDTTNLSGAQNQSQYNQLTQAPTMALNSSQANTVVNANSVTSGSFSHSADGGISYSGSCATNTFTISAGGGYNGSETRPVNYRSRSDNAFVQATLVVPFGAAQSDCEELQELQTRSAKFAYSKLQVTTCLVFIKQGIDLQEMAKFDYEQYGICPQVAAAAEKGHHGRIAEEAVRKYRDRMAQAKVKSGVNPNANVDAIFAK